MMFWWFVCCNAVCLILGILSTHNSYKKGVRDGAFNHSIPYVRELMTEHDPIRAEKILKSEGYNPIWGDADEEKAKRL